MVNWFSGCLHLGHSNIIKYCKRPFDSVEVMDKVILDNINERVAERDTLYVLGDFCWNGQNTKYLSQIRCKTVVLIKGNHDRPPWGRFMLVTDYKSVTIEGQKIVLFHYPIHEWHHSYRGAWHLCSHSHNNCAYSNLSQGEKLILDVGVDVHGFHPLSFDEVKTIMMTKSFHPDIDPDRHPELAP